MVNFKRYFITGLITILPLWLTLFIVWIVFRWISSFMAPFLSPLFNLLIGRDIAFLVRLTSFVLTIFFLWLVGFLATWIVGRRMLLWFEGIVLRVPLFNSIYSSVRKLTQSLFTNKKNFKRVVMVPFPTKDSYTVGFVTGTCDLNSAGSFTTVFIPTTPNPTTGFLVFVRPEQILTLSLSVDEAVRLIISGGIITPETKKLIEQEPPA
jgi:uncharacterized membrane protein